MIVRSSIIVFSYVRLQITLESDSVLKSSLTANQGNITPRADIE